MEQLLEGLGQDIVNAMQPQPLQAPLQVGIPQTQLQMILDAFQEPLWQAQQQVPQQQQALFWVLKHIPAQQQQQQPQLQTVLFSITPSRAFLNSPLNYESSKGLKIWEKGIKPL